jgi:cellobiose-specific phosphotransferase system component IIC
MNRTTAIILTVATALLCGCPGLFVCLGGVLTAAGLGTYTTDLLGTTSAGATPTWYGVAGICGGLILIAIPVIIGLVTLRKKAPVDMPTSVPPAV